MINKLCQKSTLLVQHLRCARIAASNQALTEFIDLLIDYCEQQQLQTNQEIIQIFDIMHTAQANNDWLYLADIIEYELIPRLQQ